jgi:hypothetical protein
LDKKYNVASLTKSSAATLPPYFKINCPYSYRCLLAAEAFDLEKMERRRKKTDKHDHPNKRLEF